MRNLGKSYSVIERSLNISKESDMNLCKYDIKINKKNAVRDKTLLVSVYTSVGDHGREENPMN